MIERIEAQNVRPGDTVITYTATGQRFSDYVTSVEHGPIDGTTRLRHGETSSLTVNNKFHVLVER